MKNSSSIATSKVPYTNHLVSAHRTRSQSKATVTRESTSDEGARSRKSTRKSVNRSRTDTALTRRSASEKSSPERRATDAQAKRTRVRGG